MMDDSPSPRGFALDTKRGYMYFARQGAGKIQRAKMDGTEVVDIYAVNGWNGPDGIALDLIRRKIYWSGLNQNLKIQRANFDGNKLEDIVTSGLAIPRHIDIVAPTRGK